MTRNCKAWSAQHCRLWAAQIRPKQQLQSKLATARLALGMNSIPVLHFCPENICSIVFMGMKRRFGEDGMAVKPCFR
jgi:hypothetical protein